jgi:hypothetical protein
MSTLMILTCAALMAVVAAILLRNLLKRNYDLLSWRNLFLVGFFHFVLLSGYFTASSGEGAIKLSSVTSDVMGLYTLSALLFFCVFMGCSRWAFRRGWVVRLLPRLELPVTSPGVIIAVVVLLGASLVSLAMRGGYLALLATNMRAGMAAAATGLATFYLLARRFNPASWALFACTLGASIAVSTAGGIGRREVLSVLIAIPWMWYFMSLRYRSAASIAVFASASAAAGVIFLVLFTGIRFKGVNDEGTRAPGAAERFHQITDLLINPSVKRGAFRSMLYTDTANVTMYIMQHYPDSYEYLPGHAALWVLVNPIPRSLYPDKPEALGIILSKHMGRAENLGPGILGQGWSEAGLIGVFAFAVFFGCLYGAVDRGLLERGSNPYFAAVMAAGAGNVFAMPRGDVALFSIQVAAAMVGSGTVLWVVKLASAKVTGAFPPLAVRLPRHQQVHGSTYAAEDEDADEAAAHDEGYQTTAADYQ